MVSDGVARHRTVSATCAVSVLLQDSILVTATPRGAMEVFFKPRIIEIFDEVAGSVTAYPWLSYGLKTAAFRGRLVDARYP